MKAKRRKTGDGGAKKNEKGNILERQELVVQRLSSEVSGKAQTYTRIGPCEFVQYHWRDQSGLQETFLTLIGTQRIVLWCFGQWAGAILSLNEAHFRFKGDPHTIYQVIEHTRQQVDCNDYNSSSSRQQCFSEPVTPLRRNWLDLNNTQLLPHAKMLLVPVMFSFSVTGRLCDFCRLFHTERSWHAYWFSAVIVSGRHDLPSDARAFFLWPLLKCKVIHCS